MNTNDSLLVDKVLDMLRNNALQFSARWFSGDTLDKSAKYKNVMIFLKTGEIIQPFRPEMSDDQKQEIVELLKPVIERDIQCIMDNM